jgi:hypothetical protein
MFARSHLLLRDGRSGSAMGLQQQFDLFLLVSNDIGYAPRQVDYLANENVRNTLNWIEYEM